MIDKNNNGTSLPCQQHHVMLFGVEGQGGIVREIEAMQKQLADLDRKISVVSGKWLALMTLLAILGNAAVTLIFKLATATIH